MVGFHTKSDCIHSGTSPSKEQKQWLRAERTRAVSLALTKCLLVAIFCGYQVTDHQGEAVHVDGTRGQQHQAFSRNPRAASYGKGFSNPWWRDSELEHPDEKRHIGAAMNLRPGNWWSEVNHAEPRYQRELRWHDNDFEDDLEGNDLVEPEFDISKRHLGAALNVGAWRYVLGNTKRHIDAALKFRPPRLDKWQLYRSGRLPPLNYKMLRGSVLDSHYGYRYKNQQTHNRVRRDLESIGANIESSLESETQDKRHIGSALYLGQRPWYNHPEQTYHKGNKRNQDETDKLKEAMQIEDSSDLAKRHFGAALNLVRGRPKWKTDEYWRDQQDEKRGASSPLDENSHMRFAELTEQIKSDDGKRHLGSAMKFRSRYNDLNQNHNTEKRDENINVFDDNDSDDVNEKRNLGSAMQWVKNAGKRHIGAERNVAALDTGKRHFGAARNAAYSKSWVKAAKRHLGSAIKFTSSQQTGEDEKRHIGSALAMGKRTDENVDDAFDKRHLGAALDFGRWNKQDYKRHIGAALAAGKREDEDGVMEKRHIGSAMKFRQQREQTEKRHIGAALAAGKREDEVENDYDKRHLGSAMKFRLQNSEPENDMEKRHIGSAMRFRQESQDPEKRHMGAALAAGKRELNENEVDKRHLGSAMRFRQQRFEDENEVDKRHLGSAMRFRQQSFEDENGMDKRHLGSAMKFRQQSVGTEKRADDENDMKKKHIGSAIRFRQESPDADKRHMGAALAVGKREDEKDYDKQHLGSAIKVRQQNIDQGKRTDDDNAMERRHLGSAMKFRKQPEKKNIGSALAAGKREEGDTDTEKRHIGSAMKFRPDTSQAEKRETEETLAAENKEGEETDVEKRHFGSAIRFRQQNIGYKSDMEKRHFGAAMKFRQQNTEQENDMEKRHLGSAMRFRQSSEVEKRAAFVDENVEDNEGKRHLGAALQFGQWNKDGKRHPGATFQYWNGLKENSNKRHLGSAMKFRGWKNTDNKRHLGSAMKFGKWNGLNEEKRHLGAAMKFRSPYQIQPEDDDDKQYYGLDKRHLGASLKFGKWKGGHFTDDDGLDDLEKRFGNSMSFGRLRSGLRPGSGQRTFGGPFNALRLNPNMGEKKRDHELIEESSEDMKEVHLSRKKRHLGTILRHGSPFLLTKYPAMVYHRGQRYGKRTYRENDSFDIFG